MKRDIFPGSSISVLLFSLCATCILSAQMHPRSSQSVASKDADLQFVVYISRHGVRSPTGDASQYFAYSRAAWPAWDVPPGYLTQHGYALMQDFGRYDRALLAHDGLLSEEGCADAAHVTIIADSDQRTRETGRALAEGMFPGCAPEVHAFPEGTPNPLFHPLHAGVGEAQPKTVTAAIADRIGGPPGSLTQTYRSQLSELDRILATCGVPVPDHPRTSLFDIPATLQNGKGDHGGELRGPLNTASTLSENFLLEYAQGLPKSDGGWGCLTENKVRTLIELHTAAFDLTQRTPAIARMQASNLLDRVNRAMRQVATGVPDPAAPDTLGDRALFFVGHDTNLASVAGLLNLHWFADGRRDDTPPGSALVFELWRSRSTGALFVRAWYTAQTLDQMRTAAPLTLQRPPQRIPLTLNGCTGPEATTCSWSSFAKLLSQTVDPAFVETPAPRRVGD
jgi:4-phytase/acid phosphatase